MEQKINTLYAQIATQKSYLNDTDYMLLRQLEGGEPMPEEVKKQRAEARAEINRLESEIATMEIELNKQKWVMY